MNKNQIVDTFNKQFIEFITDIERVFPNDTDIKSARKTINKASIIMPKTLIKLFDEHFISVYGNEIENGDINFFIENDYRTKHGYSKTDEVWVLNKIDMLRNPVKNMSEDEKKKVIQYMKNLKKLTQLYNNLRSKNNNKYNNNRIIIE